MRKDKKKQGRNVMTYPQRKLYQYGRVKGGLFPSIDEINFFT